MTIEIHLDGAPRFRSGQLARALQRALGGRAQEAFLFGSYATRTATGRSDVDLLVVAETARPFVERFREFLDLVERFAPIDLIVYTPSEWQRLKNTSFWLHARKTWVPLLRQRPRARG